MPVITSFVLGQLVTSASQAWQIGKASKMAGKDYYLKKWCIAEKLWKPPELFITFRSAQAFIKQVTKTRGLMSTAALF